MDADNILQKYILIKPNTLSYNGQYDTALQSLENVPSINRCNISSDKMTNNYHLYHQQQAFGGKIDGKKPRPLVMSKRNARERRRVKMINLGYETLRLHVPGGAENKKLSKVDTLRRAVDYIKYLQTVLEMDSSSVEIKTEANCEEEDSSQSSEVLSSDFNNIPSRPESAKTPPSVDDNSENTENEVFIDIASWLLKSPNNFRSNIRLKDMGPNDQQLFSNLM